MNEQQIEQRFTHHPPKDGTIISAHQQVRRRFRALALWINELLPDSAEKAKALDALDLAAMHTNAAIARGQTVNVPLVENL